MKKIIITFISFLSITFLNAQQDLTLFHLTSAPQSSNVNVSQAPLSKVYVLPPFISGSYFALNTDGFTLHDVLKRNQNDELVFQPTSSAGRKNINNISTDIKIPILGFGFKIDSTFISFNIETKLSARISIPSSLIDFVLLGNGHENYLGKRANFDGTGFDYLSYTEFAMGYAKKLNNHWKIGGRVKYLLGQGVFKTTQSTLGVTTNENNYAITLDGQVSVRGAGFSGAVIDSLVTLQSTEAIPTDFISIFSQKNHGIAVDLGGTYKINDKLVASISVLDLGFIKWTTGAFSKESNALSYTYEGLPIGFYSTDSATTQNIPSPFTNLSESITFEENREPFVTFLPLKMYLAASYQLYPKTMLNALTYNEIYNKRLRSSINVGITQRLGKVLMANLNYSIYGNSAKNVGLGVTLNAGPIQFYAISDNLIGLIRLEKSKNFHLRTGVNIAIGIDAPSKKNKIF